MTALLPLFPNEFVLTDPSNGVQIATLKKNGDWDPTSRCPDY